MMKKSINSAASKCTMLLSRGRRGPCGLRKLSSSPSGVVASSHVDGGSFREDGAELYAVTNSATGELDYHFEIATAETVNAAVEAAKRAQVEWAARTGTERGRVLTEAARILTARNDELARIEANDTARPIQETDIVDIVSARDCFEYFGGIAAAMGGETIGMPEGSFAYTRREPLGVTAGIGAWNYPIQGCAWKAAPALACGNAMIFKPAEDTPMTALKLAEVLEEAGLPKGLFNVVLGPGSTGQLLSRHPDIAKISFTGEASTGKSICRDASDTLKKVTMELGGKSPLIVFEDADIDSAVNAAMLANWYSCGEVCSNGTRIFVHESIKPAFLETFVERTKRIKMGDPLDPDTQLGALISHKHMETVLSYVESGKADGATLVYGGERGGPMLQAPFSNGAYVTPAIFDNCHDDMKIVREEVFGPLACILTFRDEDEVVARANDTPFGLSAGVFTRDIQRAHRVIAAIDAGTCWINNYNLAPVETPWGGFKESGIGRENGSSAVEHWTQIKSVYVEMGKVENPYP